jgi:hypothetical protein
VDAQGAWEEKIPSKQGMERMLFGSVLEDNDGQIREFVIVDVNSHLRKQFGMYGGVIVFQPAST